jgi:hypothetical protein
VSIEALAAIESGGRGDVGRIDRCAEFGDVGGAVNGLYSGLPWGWFIGIGAFDAVLAGVVLHRRRSQRDDPNYGRDGQIHVNGWWVPMARAAQLSTGAGTWEWPVHREYLRRSVYSVRVYGGAVVS